MFPCSPKLKAKDQVQTTESLIEDEKRSNDNNHAKASDRWRAMDNNNNNNDDIDEDDLKQISDAAAQIFSTPAPPRPPAGRSRRRNSLGAVIQQTSKSLVTKIKARRRGSEAANASRRSIFAMTRSLSRESLVGSFRKMKMRGSFASCGEQSGSDSVISVDGEGPGERTFLGIKHTIGRHHGLDKQVKVPVYMEHMGQVGVIECRPSDLISKIRRKMENDTTQAMPCFLRFLYSDGIPVETENEETTRASSCFDTEGKLVVCTPEDIEDTKLYTVHVIESQIAEMSSHAEAVVRCCIQFLEVFANEIKPVNENAILPDILAPCVMFFRDLARAAMALTGPSKVYWRAVESHLKVMKQELKAGLRRNEFVALMSYGASVDLLRSKIQKIQKEFLQTKLSDDHAVFFVRIAKPSRRVDSLLNTLARTNFLDLCGEKHAKTRHRIAIILSMDEIDVIKRIKSKGVQNVFETGMFRNAGPLICEDSYSSLLDVAMIKSVLAPHIDSQDVLVAKKAGSFDPRTYNWALQEFDLWTYDQTSTNRCLLFAGPPASGKTTFASHLVQNRSSVVLASHYCRHDDIQTIDAKVMLLSISYQLCLHSVPFENKIRSLLVGRRTERKKLLSQNYPITALFRDFLEGPLHDIEVPPDYHQCIIIDGIELGNEGEGEKNLILKAVRNYLSYLPSWIRLVVFTRPHSSIIKRFRTFNPKLIEPKPEDSLKDLKAFFYTALSELQYGDEEATRDASDTLAHQADGNYVYGTIMLAKARIAKEENSSCLLEDYMNLDLDQVLEKDLRLVTETCNGELFWFLVRLSLVAFQALNKADVIALVGCTPDDLELLLHHARTFFLVTDTSVIRFGQKVIKRWLLNQIGLQENGFSESKSDKNNFAATRTLFHAEIKSCHRLFSQRILKLLAESKRGSRFAFSSEMTKDYVLKYAFRHLINGGMELKARELMLDPTMLIARASDYDRLLQDLSMFPEEDELAQLLHRALTLSKKAITIDARQMVSQLVGRLKAAAIEGAGNTSLRIEMQDFVRRLENHDYGFDWWCPVTSTWEKAESALVKQIKGHDGQIQSVALHKDDVLCASASWDGEVKVFNTLTGSCEATFTGHQDAVWCVDWDHEGLQLVSGGADKCLRIWNYKERSPDWVLRGHTDCIFCAKFSPDSTLIASGSKDGMIRIWNVRTGECQQTLDAHNGFVYCVDWKPNANNQFICSGGTDNLIRLWDLKISECLLVLTGHQDWVRSVVWSTNGRKIFSGSSDQTLIYWDAFTGECQQVLMGHSGGIWAVAQSKDGRYVFSASVDRTIKAWECSTWKCDQTMEGHEGPVLSIAVSNNGSKLVSGGSDNVVALWDCQVERKASDLDGHRKPVWGIDISPDSRYIASASSDHSVRIWNMATGLVERVFTGHTGPVWSSKFSRLGRYVATASSDNTAAIYRLSTGGRKLILSHSDAVWDVAWSKHDTSLFTSCRDLVIRRWDTQEGQCIAQYRGHTKAAKALSISNNGQRMASASLDVSIRIWDLETDKCERVLKRKDAGAVSVEWLNNDCLAAGYISGCVRLWDADTGERQVGFLPGHSRRTNAVSGSPDGKRIVSASTDKEIRIWNIETQECERRISGGSGLGIFCVKWSNDGHYIVSGGSDRAIRVWRPETGRCSSVMGGVGGIGIYEVNWSPSGKFVASGSCDRKVQIWDPETGKCIKTFNGHTNWVHGVDWEEGEERLLSRSDDGTARVWNVTTGECEAVYDEAVVPEGFVVGSIGETKTVDFSGKPDDGKPIGIDIQKVRVHGQMCCGWIGKTVYFFKLKKSQELLRCLSQFGEASSNQPKYGLTIVELKD